MGIMINYRGKIDDIRDVSRLSREIEEFADILDWDIRQWDENWQLPNSASIKIKKGECELTGHVPIRGVSVIPDPDCEPLFLTFRNDGVLTNSTHMVLLADGEIDSDDMWLSTNTQFSSADTHAALIKLLKFVKNKYISDLEVQDEGFYWKYEDIAKLKKRFSRISDALGPIPDTLNLITKKDLKDRTPEQIADFIEDIIRKKFRK